MKSTRPALDAMRVYPVQLTYAKTELVRIPNYVWDWNLDPPQQVEHSSARYEKTTVYEKTTIHVFAYDRHLAWKQVQEDPNLKGVPVVGSRLVSVQVDEPLDVSVTDWINRSRRKNNVIWEN